MATSTGLANPAASYASDTELDVFIPEVWAQAVRASFKRGSLLENHPEDERESLSKLDLETLEYVTSKINNVKANVPEVSGKARGTVIDKPVDWSNKDWLKENWSTVTQSYKQKK